MLHVYEQALVFGGLDETNRSRVYRYLTPAELADTFNAIEEEPEIVAQYFQEMSTKYAAGVISEMYTDNAVDILAYVDATNLNKYLRLLPRESAAEIKEMLHYEDKTAGAIMATEFVKIVVNQTASSALHVLKKLQWMLKPSIILML